MVTVNNTKTSTRRKKQTYKDLPGGGFEYGGVQFTKEGTPTAIVSKEGVKTYSRAVEQEQEIINRQKQAQINEEKVYTQDGTGGLYYELEPGATPIKDGRFKPVQDLTKTQALTDLEKRGGTRSNIGGALKGDPLTGLKGVNKTPENVERGVMTLTPSEQNAFKDKIDRPAWGTLSKTPSESVSEGYYAGNVNLLKSPFAWDTAGTYEFNYASIELGRRVYRGIPIDEGEILRAQTLARESRLSGDPLRNVRLTTASIGQSLAQTSLGVADFQANILGAGFQNNLEKPFKWGQADISKRFKTTRLIMNTPEAPSLSGFEFTKPKTYKQFGSYLKELPNRPKLLTDITTTGAIITTVAVSGVQIYRAERLAKASRLSSLNVVAGEFASSFSPFGKIQTGIRGYTLDVGKTTQRIPGELNTLKVGRAPKIKGDLDKTLFAFEGGATYYTPKKITYGSIRTTLTGGTQPKIKQLNLVGTQIVGVSGLGQATQTQPSVSYAKGVKGVLNFDYQVYQLNKYTLGARPYDYSKGYAFKIFGKGVSKGKIDFSTGTTFYTDENKILKRSLGLSGGKSDIIVTTEKAKLTYGKSGANVVEGGQLKKVRLRTKLIEPFEEFNFFGEGTGGFYGGGRGGRIIGQTQKVAIEGPVKGSLGSSPLKDLQVTLPKTGTALGVGVGLGLGFGGGQAQQTSQNIIQLPNTQPLTSPTVLQTPQQGQTPIQQPRLIPVPTSPLANPLTPILSPPNLQGGGDITPPPFNFGTLTPGLPILRGANFGNLKYGKVPPIRTPKGYSASFTALFFKIRGKKPKGPYTGVEFRAIPGNTPTRKRRIRRVKK